MIEATTYTRKDLEDSSKAFDALANVARSMLREGMDPKGPRPDVVDKAATALAEINRAKASLRDVFALMGVRPT